MELTNFTAKANNLFVKYQPEIYLVGGITGILGATILACRATLKAKDVVDEVRNQYSDLETYKNEFEDEDSFSQLDYQQSMGELGLNFIYNITKVYGPSVVLMTISIAMIVQSRNILTERNAGLLAAYKLIDEAYSRYRERVKDEFGEEFDDYIKRKKKNPDKIKIVKENGRKIDWSKIEDDEDLRPLGVSVYARVFDERAPAWKPDSELNQFFLKTHQTFFNQKLQSKGHVFLNEVYDVLGLSRTQFGAVVGWVKGNGDDLIDFGIYNPINDYNIDYVNGWASPIVLDFNVDGYIVDLI